MTLAEFLLARIAEDEAAAQAGMSEAQYGTYGDTAADEVLGMGYNEGVAVEGMEHFARWLPARVLAECEAKRRIVERYQAQLDRQGDPEESQLSATICADEYADWTLPALALPYVDHPDYDEEWRP